MKLRRQKIWLTCAWLGLGLALGLASRAQTASAAAPMLVVEVSEVDHLAAQRLLALTEQPSQLLRASEGRDPARALALGRSAGAAEVVIFDQALGRVVVLRTDDGSTWIRGTEAASATPFMAAFVAVELLALSHGTSVVTQPPAARTHGWGTRWLALAAGVDVLTRAPDRAAARPLVGLLGAFGPDASAWSLLVGLSAAPHARSSRSFGAGRLQLTRTDLTLRVGSLWQRARLGLSTFAEAGLLVLDASYRGTPSSEQARRAFVAGLGVEPSVLLWPWLRVVGSAGLLSATPRREYRASGAPPLREPAVGVALGLGLWFTLPIRASSSAGAHD